MKRDGTPDGRSLRAVRTREVLLAATRRLMTQGVVRPTSMQIAEHAGCSVRSLFMRYEAIEDLYREALEDEHVARHVVDWVMSQPTARDRAVAIVCSSDDGTTK
jgi:AcrR family transcriptional regulator